MGKMQRGTCPECGIVLSARESSIGSVVRCKGCGAKLHLSEPEEEGEKKPPSTLAAGCGGLVVLLLLFVACGYGLNFLRDQRQKVLDEIAAAHKSYEKGDKAQAVAAYKARYSAALEEDRGLIIKRVAEHEAEQGNEAEARKWIEKGLKAKLAIAYQGGPAAKIHAVAKKQLDDEAARKKAEEDARLAERRKGQDLQEGKAAARKYIEGRLKDINARVTEASDPVSNGERWFVTGKLRDDGHPRGGVGWRVTLNRAPDASAPGKSIWTPVDGEVFPP